MIQNLPSFDNPPVVEVVMGVQFQPLEKFLAPHFGLYWETIRSDYTQCSENPPIVPQIESIGEPGDFRVAFESSHVPPLPRVLFEGAAGPWLIQIQRDRFLHNWRYYSGKEKYPRYPAVRKQFLDRWSQFSHFVDANDLGPMNVTQLEITYLNHIVPWNDDTELGDVFPDFRWRDGIRSLDRPETRRIALSFVSSDKSSRLRATIRPGVHQEKGKVLLFELTVRGIAKPGEFEAWLDGGRRWIVTAFAGLTSDEWHKKWGRTQ